MNCERCSAEFIPPRNVPTKRYCTKLCQQLCANDERKLERREASRAVGMGQEAFRVFRQPKIHDRPLKDNPQRTRVNRIDVPLIPVEYRFLYPSVRPDELVSARAPLSGSFAVDRELA